MGILQGLKLSKPALVTWFLQLGCTSYMSPNSNSNRRPHVKKMHQLMADITIQIITGIIHKTWRFITWGEREGVSTKNEAWGLGLCDSKDGGTIQGNSANICRIRKKDSVVLEALILNWAQEWQTEGRALAREFYLHSSNSLSRQAHTLLIPHTK